MYTSTIVSGLMALGFTAAASFANTTTTVTPTVAPAGPTAGSDVTVTVVTVDVLTTFCPAPTEITTNGKTYTVTSATTLTITDCPCTKTTTLSPPVTTTPVKGNDTIVWTTEVVPVYTTYCPAPTEITQGTKTYTVTQPTTLTITDCPCTISRPVTHPAPVVVTPIFNGTAPNATVVYTTEVVQTLTTYCPAPTTLTVGNTTVPVLTPGTVTISEGCPCTVTKPVATIPVTQPTPVGPTVAPSQPGVQSSVVPQNSAQTGRQSVATGGASSFGSSVVAWIAAAAFAVVA